MIGSIEFAKLLTKISFLSVIVGVLIAGLAAQAQEGQAPAEAKVEATPEAKTETKKKKAPRKAKVVKAEAKAEEELGPSTEPTTAPSRADGIVAPGEVLNFKVDPTDDGSRGGEVREPIRFSAPDADFGGGKKATDSGLDEEAPFKAYIGYPKHQIGVMASPISISSKFNYNTQPFNFKSSSLGYGLWYRLVATPLININLDWNRFTAAVAAATVSPYTVAESEETYDNYGVSGSYCYASKLSFFHRLCPGFKIANDAYPILEFTTGTALKMGKVEDIVIGLTLDYQFPVVESLLLTAMMGYNYGTGVGNSGSLTSKENNAIYARLGSQWTVASRHEISANVEYNMRTAKLKGLVGSNTDSWETTSTILGLRAAYGYTF